MEQAISPQKISVSRHDATLLQTLLPKAVKIFSIILKFRFCNIYTVCEKIIPKARNANFPALKLYNKSAGNAVEAAGGGFLHSADLSFAFALFGGAVAVQTQREFVLFGKFFDFFHGDLYF